MTGVPQAERELLSGAERRLGRLILLLTPVGASVSAWGWGWAMGVAFGFGGLLAYLNYRWIVAVVDALFRALETQSRAPRRTYVKILAPVILLAGVFYVIVSRSLLPLAGFFSGLLVLVAAVVVEAAYQILLGLRE